jgi:hypothetical protein
MFVTSSMLDTQTYKIECVYFNHPVYPIMEPRVQYFDCTGYDMTN